MGVEMKKVCPAVHVAKEVIATFGGRLHKEAICLMTPVPKLVPLASVQCGGALTTFLKAYEPRIEESGLYGHQAKIIKSLKHPDLPNIVMTTSTGSGKSLAFWAWAFEIFARERNANVIAAFPTQALLWSQAKRLATISEPSSVKEFSDMSGTYFGGTIKKGGTTIPWTVWYGTAECRYMNEHAKSVDFANARLRLCTVDKVHWSLMREKEARFLSDLRGIIIDEAHWLHGLLGANVRRMIDRLKLSMDVLGREHPSFFLASATLSDAVGFAEDLTGVSRSSFLDVNDKGAAKSMTVPTDRVPEMLAHQSEPGLLRRFVLLLRPEPVPIAARDVLGKKHQLGPEANALCFVQSKFVGHCLRDELHHALPGRDVIAYDGDLPTIQRRRVENELFKNTGKPKIVIGTNALELGIDLPTLDVVVMDELPPRRCDLLQRLGRVGRSTERPGLAVLCLGYSPGDERLIEEPLKAVNVEDIRPLALPLHLDTVCLRAMSAAFNEWLGRLKKKQASWDKFNDALDRYFGWAPTYAELKERVEDVLGDVVDLDDGSWYYRGFRVSASQGKCRLVLQTDPAKVVAVIEDFAIFRDAHPEGVYLGHRGVSYRVKRYVGHWDVATWKSPGGIVLGKYMKGLQRIEVTEEVPSVVTRGRWKDSFTLEEQKDPVDGHSEPAKGTLTVGIFTFLRKFDGYQEIDLHSRTKPKNVSLNEVANRFNAAVRGGESFPFLHNFSYRTMGWTWLIARIIDEEKRKLLANVLEPLLHGFFCDAVECSTNDMLVKVEPQSGDLRVVDGTPGGNGLSESLLTDDRMSVAWSTAIKQLKAQKRKSPEAFRLYLVEEYRINTTITAQEVFDAIERLASAWNG
jgi:Helicase conserved C-terminal domain/DEAD/DEAH box helicase